MRKIVTHCILLFFLGTGCNLTPYLFSSPNNQDTSEVVDQETEAPPNDRDPFPYGDFSFENADNVQVQSNDPQGLDVNLSYPSFSILSVKRVFCSGHDYAAIKIRNTGNQTFEYAEIWFYTGMFPLDRIGIGTGLGEDYYSGVGVDPYKQNLSVSSNTPFHDINSKCPKSQGMNSFYTGETSYLYMGYEHSDRLCCFELGVFLCTLDNRYGDCVYIEISPNLHPYVFTMDTLQVFSNVIENFPCLEGPHPDYGIIRTIKSGEVVEIVAQSSEPGYYVIQDTKYDTWCYLSDSAFEEQDPSIVAHLPIHNPPPLPFIPIPHDSSTNQGCLVVKNLSEAPKCVVPCPDPDKYPDQCEP